MDGACRGLRRVAASGARGANDVADADDGPEAALDDGAVALADEDPVDEDEDDDDDDDDDALEVVAVPVVVVVAADVVSAADPVDDDARGSEAASLEAAEPRSID